MNLLLMTTEAKQLPKRCFRVLIIKGGGEGGHPGCSSDGDDQMEGKNQKPKEIPRASNKTPKNPWNKT